VSADAYKEFPYADANPSHMHGYFMPRILELAGELKPGTRVLDVGCGNGSVCGEFLKRGCAVTGIDLSEQGVAIARQLHPQGRFEVLPADDRLLVNLSEEHFDLIVSSEVVEHLYAPRAYARGCFQALKPGGTFVCTTPYHGYLKNLALSLANKWDAHADPLWDGGHIKLWSRKTLFRLLTEVGFEELRFRGAGRMPWLWMTMVVAGKKPQE
jgi:2-polyprenyl-3-methyl-5-hydroxy-6-metoxy-1,4-benzoquinol methylase